MRPMHGLLVFDLFLQLHFEQIYTLTRVADFLVLNCALAHCFLYGAVVGSRGLDDASVLTLGVQTYEKYSIFFELFEFEPEFDAEGHKKTKDEAICDYRRHEVIHQ